MNFTDFIYDFLEKERLQNKGITYLCKHLNKFITLKGDDTDICQICSEEIKVKYAKNKNK